MEVFPQTQGGVELWPGVLLLHTWVVPNRLCSPTAPPSAWSVSCFSIVTTYKTCNSHSAVQLLSVLIGLLIISTHYLDFTGQKGDFLEK